ncbi:polymorphic toxin type 25 domain-containing protein [Pantoea ananatis]|uniref:polymorphic toxin type 25 domain-containing protein n=3 Tax=Pantoea ananas TaxID=553 RepID=UPI0021AAE889|nr:polymorphic toxin type 25 domain-containing protein [Pantoea ananatis]
MLDKAHEKDPNVDNSRQAVVSKAWQLAYVQAIVRQGADMGGSVRTGVNAVVNALQALAGGDIRAALVQGAAPYLAAKVKELTTGNAPYGELTDTQKLNNLMAHALLGGVVAELSGGSASAGATGAVTGELAAPAIALALYGTADSDKLSPEQKANLSALATLASGIAAGVATGSTSGAATGALAGKNAVENNSFSDGWNNILPSGGMDYGKAVSSWNKYALDNDLSPDKNQDGLKQIATGEGPSLGAEGKVTTVVQVNGDVAAAVGYTITCSIDNRHLSVTGGDIYGFGAHAGASVGLSFGPYFPGVLGSPDRDYSFNLCGGFFSFSATGNKDGLGFSFGIGPSWGISATEIRGVDLNGTATSEIYSYEFK